MEQPRERPARVGSEAAKQLAQREGCSLRDACLRLGRPSRPVVLSGATAVDLFNLEFGAR
jgi:hypothetical protein